MSILVRKYGGREGYIYILNYIKKMKATLQDKLNFLIYLPEEKTWELKKYFKKYQTSIDEEVELNVKNLHPFTSASIERLNWELTFKEEEVDSPIYEKRRKIYDLNNKEDRKKILENVISNHFYFEYNTISINSENIEKYIKELVEIREYIEEIEKYENFSLSVWKITDEEIKKMRQAKNKIEKNKDYNIEICSIFQYLKWKKIKIKKINIEKLKKFFYLIERDDYDYKLQSIPEQKGKFGFIRGEKYISPTLPNTGLQIPEECFEVVDEI